MRGGPSGVAGGTDVRARCDERANVPRVALLGADGERGLAVGGIARVDVAAVGEKAIDEREDRRGRRARGGRVHDGGDFIVRRARAHVIVGRRAEGDAGPEGRVSDARRSAGDEDVARRTLLDGHVGTSEQRCGPGDGRGRRHGDCGARAMGRGRGLNLDARGGWWIGAATCARRFDAQDE